MLTLNTLKRIWAVFH